jgi:hypothetical protein
MGFAIAVIVVVTVVLIVLLKAREQTSPALEIESLSFAVPSDHKRAVSLSDDDSSPFPAVPPEELAAFIRNCLRDHHAMSCWIGREEQTLVPLSLIGDQLTATPLNFSSEGNHRRKTFRLTLIRERACTS